MKQATYMLLFGIAAVAYFWVPGQWWIVPMVAGLSVALWPSRWPNAKANWRAPWVVLLVFMLAAPVGCATLEQNSEINRVTETNFAQILMKNVADFFAQVGNYLGPVDAAPLRVIQESEVKK
jgi:hypothetical protein